MSPKILLQKTPFFLLKKPEISRKCGISKYFFFFDFQHFFLKMEILKKLIKKRKNRKCRKIQ